MARMSLLVSIIDLSGNGVEASLVERVTTEDPPQAEERSPGQAMLGDSLGGIIGAGWVETAVVPKKRRKRRLVGPDQKEGQDFHFPPVSRPAASRAFR